MFYKHQYFTLDLDTKKVFDENKKELHITGNAYRVLVFLCENRSGTITSIGGSLDWAKDYDENHLRQYRYKIETMIGHKVVEYKNGVYTIIGELEKVDTLANNERNTVLLHPSSVGLGQTDRIMNIITKIKPFIFPAILVLAVLLAFLFWPKTPAVKKSTTGICHKSGTYYYNLTKNFTSYSSIEKCLQSGGRLPK